MSLLLDALKKAADDKKKNLLIDDAEEKSSDTDESLELELDLDTSIEEPSDVDDFPKVNEASIAQAVIQEPTNKNSLDNSSNEEEAAEPSVDIISDEASIDTTAESTDISQQELDVKTEDRINEDSAKIIDSTSKPTLTSVTNNNDETVEKEEVANDKPQITKNHHIPKAKNNLTKNIATEQALSALINKSNQHSKQAHLKQTITISVLVALLLIGSGLFFYIKMDTASQEIFIADNNQASVNRSIEPIQQVSRPIITKTKKIVSPKKAAVNKKTAPIKIAKKTKSIKIVHTEKQDPVSTLILEAYNQFHHENYKQANNLYNQVILREPKNRDALLGLSAIAIKQQRYEFARQKYQYLLRLNPKDSFAIAGISSIKNDIDPQLNESQIKFMLKEKPDAAHLYFALGSLHSSQNKWPEAQSAYFSAWSAENKNADYAYNLAVSLDHLDKRSRALDFYKLSLKLKQASNGNFDTENTLKRILTLKENNE